MTFGEAMIAMEKGEHCKPFGGVSRYYIDYNKAHQKTLFYSVGEGWKTCPKLARDLVGLKWELCPKPKTKKRVVLHEYITESSIGHYRLEWLTAHTVKPWKPGTYYETGKTKTVEVPSAD